MNTRYTDYWAQTGRKYTPAAATNIRETFQRHIDLLCLEKDGERVIRGDLRRGEDTAPVRQSNTGRRA